MASFDLVLLTQAVGFGMCLWLGLYLLVRAEHRTALITVSVLALWMQAAFFGASMLTFNARDLPTLVTLERAFWWASVLPSAAWFHFSSLIVQQAATSEHPRLTPITRLLVIVVYLAALVIVVAGTATNLFINYAEPIVTNTERFAYLDRGPAYPIQIAFLALTGVGALTNLIRTLIQYTRSRATGDRALAQQLKILVGGALLFLAGALYISSRFTLNPSLSVLPGYVCLFLGLAGISYGIANFGLLLEGKDIRRDFWYNVTGIGLINVLYVAMLSLTGLRSIAGLLAVVGLVTLTHMLVDNGRSLLDLVFFSRAERDARNEAREYATDLGTTPVAISAPIEQPTDQIADEPPPDDAPAIADALAPEIASEKAFKSAVRKALTGLKSPPQLAKNPLLTLKLVEHRLAQADQIDNRLNRVAVLRELLIEQIDGLRPRDGSSMPTGDAWRFYNVLYFPYVRAVSRKGALVEARRMERERQRSGQREASELEQVLSWLADVDEDTFYKWQRRASDTIAAILWEENQKLIGVRV